MAITLQTWRHAFRSLCTTPLVSVLAVLSIALGIGANTAIFSIFNSLVLRSLPVREPVQLASLKNGSWTYPIWQEIERSHGALFDGALAWSSQRFDLSQGGQTEFVDGSYVSGRTFDVLGVPAVRGRMLAQADDSQPGGPDAAVAVISHRFWQQRFSGDDVVGQRLTLERVSFTIVGVMPPGFTGPDVGKASDVMIPFAAEPLIRGKESFLAGRSTWWLDIMVRLKPDQNLERANAALRAAQPQIRAATAPTDWPASMLARYLSEPFTLESAAAGRSDLRTRLATPLIAMLVAVGLVLLIACANIANLLMARAMARRREMSVRRALGASPWQVAQLLLAESLLIAVAGAGLGLLFARWSSAVLVSQFSSWRGDVFLDLSLDWRVLAFTAFLTVITTLAAGVAPALGAARVSPNETLKEAGRGVVGERRFGLRGALVVAQIALSLMLVIAAGLFLRTFTALSHVPLGFTPEPLIVVNLNLQPSRFGPSDRAALVERMRDAAATVPGVTGASASLITPLTGQGWNAGVGEMTIPDRSKMTWMNAVMPGWFSTNGVRLIGGRDFDNTDRVGAEVTAIVNESFARRFLIGQQPVGQMVRTGGPGGQSTEYRVVGLVGDAVYRNPREGAVPTMYVPFAQREQIWPSVSLTVAAAHGQRAAVERRLSETLKGVDPTAAFTFRTFDALIDAAVQQERLLALLSTFFGGLALLLAAIGLYGVVSHAVGRRRQEIGIRMALGADPARIVRIVFGRVGVLLSLGVLCGLGLSLWASRFVHAMLFQLDENDPATLATATVVLVAVGSLAAWIPARRAARVDPAVALRD